jgi:hypothetical protein
VTLLRFHQELYDGFAVDEAVKAYAGLARFELVREDQGYVVKLEADPAALPDGIDEATLGRELANYALGKTIENAQRRAEPKA